MNMPNVKKLIAKGMNPPSKKAHPYVDGVIEDVSLPAVIMYNLPPISETGLFSIKNLGIIHANGK